MKQKYFGRRGSITTFLCIVLSAIILLETIYVSGAFQRKKEVQLSEAVSHQVEQLMACFDLNALDWYGVYALSDVGSSHAVFDEMVNGLDGAFFEASGICPLSTSDLESAIVEYMRLRGLAFEGSGLFDRLGYSISKIDEAGGLSGNGISKWLPTFKEYVQNQEKWKNALENVAKLANIVGLDEKLEDFFDFADSILETWEENSSAILQVGDTSVTVSLFDPTSIEKLTSVFDAYMDQDLPSIFERLLMNEYAVYQFDSRVTSYVTDAGTEKEANILGIPFEDIHSENRPDMEYLLLGQSDSVNRLGASGLIFGTRLILDLGSYLMDSSKKEIALGIAEIISVLVMLVSGGTVYIEPSLMQYVILFMMAYIRAELDMFRLIKGKSVPIIYSKKTSDSFGDLFETNYRDYFRLFFLFVPKETLLQRMKTVIERDCGATLYTGISASGVMDNSKYTIERRFELYENH